MNNKEDIKEEAQKFREDLETRMGDGFVVKRFIPNFCSDSGRLRLITDVSQDQSWDSENHCVEIDKLTKIIEERLSDDYEILYPRPLLVSKDGEWEFMFIAKVIQRKEYHYEDNNEKGYYHPYREWC